MKALEPTTARADRRRLTDFDALADAARRRARRRRSTGWSSTSTARQEYRAAARRPAPQGAARAGPAADPGRAALEPAGAGPHAVRGAVRRGDPPGRRRSSWSAGDIPTAWAYFRAIGEPEPVAGALDDYVAGRRRRAAGPGHRGRVQSRGEHPARVRADPRALRHLLGDHGVRAGSRRATRRPESPASSG